MGSGSNLLVADAGVRGLVVKLDKRTEHRSSSTASPATASSAAAARACPPSRRRPRAPGCPGIEFGVSIPGTVGGAVRMNANAYGGELADVLEWVDVVSAGGTERRTPDQLGFTYRRSNLGAGEIVARAAFKLAPADAEARSRRRSPTCARGARRRSRPGSRRSARRSRTPTIRAPRGGPRASCSTQPAVAACASAAPASAPSTRTSSRTTASATTADVIALMAEGRGASRSGSGSSSSPRCRRSVRCEFPSDWGRGDRCGRAAGCRERRGQRRGRGLGCRRRRGCARHARADRARRGGCSAGGWLWFRDSSLVAVERVTVTGLSGPDARQIRARAGAAPRRG